MGEAWAQNQVERFQFNFEKADKDKSGSLSFAEVYAVLKSNGFNGSETEAQFIFSHLDKNKDHKITKDEFTSAMKNLPRLSIKEFALRKAFLDLDKDASGFLTRTEIEDGITNNAGLDITTDKFSELLIYLCKEDKDKKVSYEEFLYVFGVEATAVELRRVFTVLDKDGSGLLSRDEILEAVRADFELKLAAEKISDLLILYSSKYKAADKSISYDEFVTVWLKQKEEKPKK